MAKSGSLFTFLLGAATGAAAAYLALTDEGREMVKEGRKAAGKYSDEVLRKMDELRQAVKESYSDGQGPDCD